MFWEHDLMSPRQRQVPRAGQFPNDCFDRWLPGEVVVYFTGKPVDRNGPPVLELAFRVDIAFYRAPLPPMEIPPIVKLARRPLR